MKELIAALIAARQEIDNPKTDSVNPHFKNRYASLAAVIAAVQPALAKHGLCVVQQVNWGEAGTVLVTHLYHESGEEIQDCYPLPSNLDSQKMGSAITYARRYALCALLNIAAEEDDDGNGAGPADRDTSKPTPAKPQTGSGISDAQRKRLFAIANKAGWGKQSMADELVNRFDIESTADIQKGSQYDSIVAHFERPPKS